MAPFMGACLAFKGAWQAESLRYNSLRIPPPRRHECVCPSLPPSALLAAGGRTSLHHLAPQRQSSPQPLPAPRRHRGTRLRLDGSLSRSGPLRPHLAQAQRRCPNGLPLPASRRRQSSPMVMPNHVHVLLTPIISPSKLLQSVKGFSAREANKILGRTG